MLRYHNVNEPDSEPGFFDEHRDPITCLATTVSSLSPLLTGSSLTIAVSYSVSQSPRTSSPDVKMGPHARSTTPPTNSPATSAGPPGWPYDG